MAIFGGRGRRDLDAWARFLDVRTDDEAVAKLRSLKARADRLADEAAALRDDLRDAPDPDLVHAAGETSGWAATVADSAVVAVIQRFQRHERGGR